MVLFDTNYLLHLLRDNVPASEQDAKKWVDKLVVKLQQLNERIVIPTPVLGEVLVHAGKAVPTYLSILHKASRFKIVPFDELAAIKSAELLAVDIKDKNIGKKGGATGDWSVIKVDRQIVTMAFLEGVKTVYSDDEGVETLSKRVGLQVIRLADLPSHVNPVPLLDPDVPAL